MKSQTIPSPLTRAEVIVPTFILNRTRVVALAAYLDRIDRAPAGEDRTKDFLIEALVTALQVLVDGRGDRAQRVLDQLSDPTIEPLISAAGMKGAFGAFRSRKEAKL